MHFDARAASSIDGRVELVTRDLEGKVQTAEALSLGIRRMLFEQELTTMQGHALRRALLARPEPRPFL